MWAFWQLRASLKGNSQEGKTDMASEWLESRGSKHANVIRKCDSQVFLQEDESF